MNFIKGIFTTTLLLLCFTVFAQEGMEDVLYLKNGNVYRGLIIEQVPGETMRIQSEGGNVFTVQISEIQKITKEKKWMVSATESKPVTPSPVATDYKTQPNYKRSKYDSTFVPHFKKKRTYFFLAEVRAGMGNGGVRVVNGYKFGRFGFLGIGMGIDGATFGGGDVGGGIGNSSGFSSGVYLPLYVRYSGDILRKKITPFYFAEMGYGIRPPALFSGNQTRSYGGPMGALGFGCKFNTYRRINFSLNLNVNWKSNFYKGTYYSYDYNTGENYSYQQNGFDANLFGSFGFGIGF
jgi:hypothetical protein